MKFFFNVFYLNFDFKGHEGSGRGRGGGKGREGKGLENKLK
jgi:hypothetical protein